jgi:reactive intermediate/imine deaminase
LPDASESISFWLNGREVEVPNDGSTLLEVLRETFGIKSAKDGCSPQGQCGCCTVWIDDSARVSCVTPITRVARRKVTTIEGLTPRDRERWARAFEETGASQCGFCTPGIIMRLAAMENRRTKCDEAAIRSALLAHLCRCTGWQTIVEAALGVLNATEEGDLDPASLSVGPGVPRERVRDPLMSSWRAQIEGPAFQSSGAVQLLGAAGFADDTAPRTAIVGVPDGDGGYLVADTLRSARSRSGKVQGRNSSAALSYPVELPPGDWALTLETTWVEPAYLEPDASWCTPGGIPATPLANGGAFGGKRRATAPEVARRLANEHDRAVRVLWSREDVTRYGPKRPPVAIGVLGDGTGVMRIAVSPDDREDGAHRVDEMVRKIARMAPGITVETVEILGPTTSPDLRGAGWVEAAVVVAALDAIENGEVGPGARVQVKSPGGGRATSVVSADGSVLVEVWAGEVLDEVTLRSYCIGAVHQAVSWVFSEGISVDQLGEVQDLTVRSFGIVNAREMPNVEVVVNQGEFWPVNASDAVFAATAGAAWLADGLPPRWPTRRGRTGGRTGGIAKSGNAADREVVDMSPVSPVSPVVGPYAPVKRVGEWVLTSGQLGVSQGEDRGAELVAGGTAGELRQALTNLSLLLNQEGVGLIDVVKATVFVVDMADLDEVNEIWAEFFPLNPPARTTAAVAALPLGARVEVEAWAHATRRWVESSAS